jgi:GNAT superfamily N-acetyltransferase
MTREDGHRGRPPAHRRRPARGLGRAADRDQSHWFGGRLVPACGIGGVLVVPERRGRGLARLVLTAASAGPPPSLLDYF